MMVTSELAVYRSGTEQLSLSAPLEMRTLYVRSEGRYSNCVALEYRGVRFTVNGDELVAAIKNARNTG